MPHVFTSSASLFPIIIHTCSKISQLREKRSLMPLYPYTYFMFLMLLPFFYSQPSGKGSLYSLPLVAHVPLTSELAAL